MRSLLPVIMAAALAEALAKGGGGERVSAVRRLDGPAPLEPVPDLKDDRRKVSAEEKRRRKRELRKATGRRTMLMKGRI